MTRGSLATRAGVPSAIFSPKDTTTSRWDSVITARMFRSGHLLFRVANFLRGSNWPLGVDGGSPVIHLRTSKK